MKKITSAVLGLSLSLAVAGISFAQTTAAQTPSKDSKDTMAAAPAKKHVKKHKKSSTVTAAQPTAPATVPAAK